MLITIAVIHLHTTYEIIRKMPKKIHNHKPYLANDIGIKLDKLTIKT